MRRIYSLLTGFILSLVFVQAQAQYEAANFTFTTAGNTVQFTNTSNTAPGDTAMRRCLWLFGDGSALLTHYSTNPTHTYAQNGTYQACLKLFKRVPVTTPNGDSLLLLSSTCKSIHISSPDSCSANFEMISVGSTSLGKYFIAQPWHNNQNKPEQICWTFGDGTDTCINYNPTQPPPNAYAVFHQYNQPGTYTVCVTIRYQGGCEAHFCKTLQIGVQVTCGANFEVNPITTTPLGRKFTAITFHSQNKKPIKICWNFGDNNDTCIYYPTSYTGPYSVNHIYNNHGNYNVCVKIFYEGGCEAHYCKVVGVNIPDSCTANFQTGATPASVLSRQFTAIPWHSTQKKPVYICWDFGDNRDTCIQYSNTYSGPYFVNHTYASPGQYNVCVRIVYEGGCEARKCHMTQVGTPDSCQANFERLPVTTATPLTASFKALPWHNNNNKPILVCWNFGDNQDTCIQYSNTYSGPYTVTHIYAIPGNYNICVRIVYVGGCEAIKCKPVTISQPPGTCTAQIHQVTQSNTSLTRGLFVTPTSSTNRRVEKICWRFGDGTDTCIITSTTNPLSVYSINHTYPGPGTYHTCVKVFFAGGCIAESCIVVEIRSINGVCGGYFTDSLSGPRTVKLKGYSIHSPGDNVLSYHWTFGDGSIGIGQNVTHTYNQPGTYQVCLMIKTERGCETRICKKIIIGGLNTPVLYLTPNPVINYLHAVFISTHTEPVTIRITNSSGNVVRTYIRNATAGPNAWDFNLSDLLPGIYSFMVQSPNQMASAIFIKL